MTRLALGDKARLPPASWRYGKAQHLDSDTGKPFALYNYTLNLGYFEAFITHDSRYASYMGRVMRNRIYYSNGPTQLEVIFEERFDTLGEAQETVVNHIVGLLSELIQQATQAELVERD